MHHWQVGGTINIGWPDYGIPERAYTIVEFDLLGGVFRARVTDGEKEGGFLVVYDCPDVVLEILAEQATRSLDFKVIKNKLARKAAKDTPFEILDSYFRGPISLVVSYDDSIAPAKALADYAKTGVKKSPEVICGLVEGKSLTPDEVKVLSELPPKVVLVAQILGVFQGPTTNFVRVFNSLLRKLVGTLDAVREKKASG